MGVMKISISLGINQSVAEKTSQTSTNGDVIIILT